MLAWVFWWVEAGGSLAGFFRAARSLHVVLLGRSEPNAPTHIDNHMEHI